MLEIAAAEGVISAAGKVLMGISQTMCWTWCCDCCAAAAMTGGRKSFVRLLVTTVCGLMWMAAWTWSWWEAPWEGVWEAKFIEV